MRSFRLIPRSDYQVYPWKNGRGQSLRIAGDDKEPFGWRLSLSKIESSGPFSPYPGYRRFLVPLSPGPLRLRHNQKRWLEIAPLSVHAFRGEWATEAQCESPVDDFNLMVAEPAGEGSVFTIRIAPGEETWFPTNGQRHFLYCHQGKLTVTDPEEMLTMELKSGDTLEVRREKKKELRPLQARGAATVPSEVVWVTLHLASAK